MSRFLFLLYCLAAWEMGLFEPLLAINMLLFGGVIIGLYRERHARPPGLAGDRRGYRAADAASERMGGRF